MVGGVGGMGGVKCKIIYLYFLIMPSMYFLLLFMLMLDA